jgi:hypothetical protein
VGLWKDIVGILESNMASISELRKDIQGRFSKGGGRFSRQHDELLNLVKQLKREGQASLEDRRMDMERADEIYRAFKIPDKEDKKAAERGEPMKIIYPVTYAQIQTAVSGLVGMLTKSPFFELEGRGPEFHRGSKLMEVEIQYQLDQVGWTLVMYQWFLDMLKYGFGKLNIGYEKKQSYITSKRRIPMGGFFEPLLQLFGFEGEIEVTRPVVGYEGASLFVDDPHEVMFDPSVSIGDIQRAQYVFHQRKYSLNELKSMADEEGFFNLDEIPASGRAEGTMATNTRGKVPATFTPHSTNLEGGNIVTVDYAYIKLVPRDYELSEVGSTQIWCIAMANDSLLIKIEPSRYEHGMFPTSVIEYSPDLHRTTNEGMAQTIEGLQGQINWLLNSHIANVRKVLNDVLIVDPSLIEVQDLVERKNIVRLKQAAGRVGVERAIKQLSVVDVTASHVNDAMVALQMIQRATGISDNFMGIQLPTVRTATEVSQMNRLAAGRIRLMSQLVFDQGLRPLGMQMVQNTQQFMSISRFARVTGSLAKSLMLSPEQMGQFVEISPEEIQGFFMVKVSDANTPTDKLMIASKLQELLMAAMQNSMAVQALGIDLQQVAVQMLMNFGIENVSDFIRPPGPMPEGGGGRPVKAQVMPEEHVQRMQEQGDLVPLGGENGRSATSGFSGIF